MDRQYKHPEDYNKVIKFLREIYLVNEKPNGWTAQRFEDMEYRINTLYLERGKPNWHSCIRIWQKENAIVGVGIGEEDEYLHTCIADGYENLFDEMLKWKESLLQNSGKTLTVAVIDSQTRYIAKLKSLGYTLHEKFSYIKSQIPCCEYKIELPSDYFIINGLQTQDTSNIIKKYQSVEKGFHPETEGQNLKISKSFQTRENAPMFDYKYEIMVKNNNDEFCSYMYTWVDKETSSAYIEPVCTRITHRRKGLLKAMINTTLNILAKEKIKKCWVTPYGDVRDKVYTSCGFQTENIEYWFEKKM